MKTKPQIVLDMMIERSDVEKKPVIDDSIYCGDLNIVLDSIHQSFKQGVMTLLSTMTVEEKLDFSNRVEKQHEEDDNI